MEFPKSILLVGFGIVADKIDIGLEGSMVHAVEAFDDLGLPGFRFETAIICWSSLYSLPDAEARLADTDLRKRLVDWVNLQVSPRLRPTRRPVWL